MKTGRANTSWQMRGAESFSVNAPNDSFVAFGTKWHVSVSSVW